MPNSEHPWKTDQFFSSPWNYLAEVTEGFSIPEQVQVHDVTLRDGEQQAGVVLRADEKLRIAEALAAAGVHRIEAGLPAVSPADEAAVRAIVDADLPSEIYAFSRCIPEDVQLALDCGVTGVVLEIPASHHLIEKAYLWPTEKAIDLSIEATRIAHDYGLKVSFFPIDATRAGMVELLDDLATVASDGHVDTVGLVDTYGVTSPHAISFFARSVRDRLGVPLETHFHMDFAMGVANTAIAVTEGASVIQTTVAGIGERAGNTPMEETLLALLTMYGIDTGVDTTHFYDIARLVLSLTGVDQPSNRPAVGERLFHIESGIPAAWLNNVGEEYMTEVFPYRPELVGQPAPQIVMGKGSGLDSVAIWMDRLGLKWSDSEELRVILADVKTRSLEKKGLIDEDEFVSIVQKTITGATG